MKFGPIECFVRNSDLDPSIELGIDRSLPTDSEMTIRGVSEQIPESGFYESGASEVERRQGKVDGFVQKTRVRAVEKQRNRLAAIVRLSDTLHQIELGVIRQSTTEEIDHLVCEGLVESGEYAAAWIGDVNRGNGLIDPRAVAGNAEEVGDSVAFDAATEADVDTEDGAVRVGPNADDATALPAFDRSSEYESIAVVPLSFEDVRYGVLKLFSVRENAFQEHEMTLLEQVGQTVGHAINSLERKQALVGDSVTELKIRLPGMVKSLDFTGDAGVGDHTITVDGTVPGGGERVIQYLSVTGLAPRNFQEAIADVTDVDTVREIGKVGDSYRYEVSYADSVIFAMAATYGGRIQSVQFDVPDLEVTVSFPQRAEVRQIVQSLRSEVPELEIEARRQVTPGPTRTEPYWNEIEATLTERQRTALLTAFFSGYFDWPRESTGEEVAETLGVTPSTFHQHLRVAQWKVLSTMIEDEYSA